MRLQDKRNNNRLCFLTVIGVFFLIHCVTGTIILNDASLQGSGGSKYLFINSPGNYFVNLSSSTLSTSYQTAIQIWASDVSLDGGNLTVHNAGGGTYGVRAEHSGMILSNVNIRNFTIDSYGGTAYAVDFENVYTGSIRNITSINNHVGIWTYNSSYLSIENCDMRGWSDFGIFLNIDCNNNQVRDNYIHDGGEGLYVIQSDNNSIYRNNVSNNTMTGIYLGYQTHAFNNSVYENIAVKNAYGILLDRYCNNNSVFSNTVRYNSLGGIMLVMDSGNKVFNNTVSDTTENGIYLETANHHNEIYNNTVSRNKHGIVINTDSYRNNLYENIVSANNERGIWLSQNSTYNNIYSNNATGNGYGILIYASGHNVIENNSINSSTQSGYYLDRTAGLNEFRKNRVMNNPVGVFIFSSSNEKIVNNYFNNVKNVGLATTHANNVWNYSKTAGKNIINGPYLGGNFYGTPTNTGFSQVTPDADRDGICDSSSTFPPDSGLSDNIDYLPLHAYSYPQNIGVFRNGFWILDANGNYQWDGTGPGADVVAGFGMTGDKPVTGNWNHTLSGDKIGVFRDGTWLLDYNGNFQWDGSDKSASLGQSGDLPATGDWNSNGDKKIGVFRNGFWILDKNGNFLWDSPPTDVVAGFGMAGDIPVVADWQGTQQDKIGVFRNGFWILDGNGNYAWDGTGSGKDIVAGFGMAGDVPEPKDWNGDGKPEIAVFRPSTGQWIIDYNGNYAWDGTGPGQDVTATLGQNGDVAVTGDWDSTSTDKPGIFRNGFWILDYNGNFLWDGAPPDKVLGFGTTGDISVVGRWR